MAHRRKAQKQDSASPPYPTTQPRNSRGKFSSRIGETQSEDVDLFDDTPTLPESYEDSIVVLPFGKLLAKDSMLLQSQWENLVGVGAFVEAVDVAKEKSGLEKDDLTELMTDLIG
ncbi:hypothetical protein MMC31_002185 [Peltigera leucophlebia]|nr:hypothetical protein [Peltigera leucophlebia]